MTSRLTCKKYMFSACLILSPCVHSTSPWMQISLGMVLWWWHPVMSPALLLYCASCFCVLFKRMYVCSHASSTLVYCWFWCIVDLIQNTPCCTTTAFLSLGREQLVGLCFNYCPVLLFLNNLQIHLNSSCSILPSVSYRQRLVWQISSVLTV